ncbi:hypothetical protein NIBR502774_19845 (plasmid) [Rhizobium sp. NIBRBAC000502774]|nr:hypothetical protein NIBR502774_19845 [Rhizobium sp. NIBRBAC000502774]
MCEPTFEDWFLSFAAESERLTGVAVDFDNAYDRYFPAFEDSICGGTCARLSVRTMGECELDVSYIRARSASATAEPAPRSPRRSGRSCAGVQSNPASARSLPADIPATCRRRFSERGILRRLRERLRASRDLLAKLLKDRVNGYLDVAIPDQGINLTARSTGTWTSDTPISQAALSKGVVVMPLSRMNVTSSDTSLLMFGFSGLSVQEAHRGTRLLAEAFKM